MPERMDRTIIGNVRAMLICDVDRAFGPAAALELVGEAVDLRRDGAGERLIGIGMDSTERGVDLRTFADARAVGHIHAAGASFGGKFYQSRAFDAQAFHDFRAGQFHDAFTFRRFVRQRTQRAVSNQIITSHAIGRVKIGGFAVADGDGAGFVEQ